MTATSPSPSDEGTSTSAPGLRDVVRAFREISEAISSDSDLDFVLHLVARKITRLLGVQRCSVYLRATPAGLFRGQVAETGSDQDHMIKRLTCGGPADRFTEEIVRTKHSVLLVNAQADPRPVRSTMREWKVRTMLGVPMVVRDEVFGLLFLDDAENDYDFTSDRQDLAASFADLAGITIHQAIQAQETGQRVTVLERQRAALQRNKQVDDRLSELALDCASLQEIARAVALLTNKGVAIHGADGQTRAVASGVAQDTSTLRILERANRPGSVLAATIDGLPPRRPTIVGPFPGEGITERVMITRVSAGGEDLGFVVIAETRGRFTAPDAAAADRAAMVVAFGLLSERRAAQMERLARDILVRDLVHDGQDAQGLGSRAETLGVDLAAPMVVVALGKPPTAGSAFVAEDLAQVTDAGGRSDYVGATIISDDLLVVVLRDPASVDVRARAERLRAAVSSGGRSVTAVVSSVCRGAAECPEMLGEIRSILDAELARGDPAAGSTVMAADLGVERLFLAPGQQAAVERFAQQTLEPLYALGSRGTTILETVRAFYAVAQSTRRAAQILGIHENTVRYRLRRAEEVLGMQITTDPEHQLAVHLALAMTAGVDDPASGEAP